jgi:ADP-ribosylglycohydrolase
MIDKFKGCIYGLAIGDAFGFPVEFITLEEIKKKYGEVQDLIDSRTFPAGTYTDDTQMTLAIAKGILNANDPNNLNEVMDNISSEFVRWSTSKENNRAPGNSCMSGCRNLAEGVHWSESGVHSKGCGAAMRSAPIGLFYNNLDKVVEVAGAASKCTHGHPTGIASGIATAALVYFAKRGVAPEDMLDKVCQATEKYDSELELIKKIIQVNDVLRLEPEKAIPQLGEGWVGDEAVAISLYSFLRSPKDYKKTMITAANITGDSDSTACIAGAISGAYNGVQVIPKQWIQKVENSEMLGKVAEQLYEKSR